MKNSKWIPAILAASLIGACGESTSSGDIFGSIENFRSLENQSPANLTGREGKIVKEAVVFGVISSFRLFARDTSEQSLSHIRAQVLEAMSSMYENENSLSESIDDLGTCAGGSGSLKTVGSGIAASKPSGAQVDFNSQASGTITMDACSLKLSGTAMSPITGKLSAKASFNGSVERVVRDAALGTRRNQLIDSEQISMLSGTYSGSMDQAPYTVELKDFGVAFQLTKAKIEEYRQIKADPLGHDEIVSREKEFFRSLLKCTGDVVIEGKTFDCGSIVTWVNDQRK